MSNQNYVLSKCQIKIGFSQNAKSKESSVKMSNQKTVQSKCQLKVKFCQNVTSK